MNILFQIIYVNSIGSLQGHYQNFWVFSWYFDEIGWSLLQDTDIANYFRRSSSGRLFQGREAGFLGFQQQPHAALCAFLWQTLFWGKKYVVQTYGMLSDLWQVSIFDCASNRGTTLNSPNCFAWPSEMDWYHHPVLTWSFPNYLGGSSYGRWICMFTDVYYLLYYNYTYIYIQFMKYQFHHSSFYSAVVHWI